MGDLYKILVKKVSEGLGISVGGKYKNKKRIVNNTCFMDFFFFLKVQANQSLGFSR